MDAAQTLLLVLAIQLSLAASGWLIAGTVLGLPRGPALHWAAFCVLGTAATLPGLLGTPPLSAPVVAAGNLTLMGAYVALTRGVVQFLRLPDRVAWDAAALAAVLATSAWDLLAGWPPGQRAAVVGVVLAGYSAVCAWRLAAPIHRGYGVLAATFICGPLALTTALFGWRALRLFQGGVPTAQVPMSAASTLNVVVLLVLATITLLVNLSLSYLVVVRLVRRLQHLSSHDSLTGLLNRRAFLAQLDGELARLRRGGPGCALLLLDLDHFKQVNDRHGHAMGDAVLMRAADALRESARGTDIVARTGGEEFCVLAPMTDAEGARMLAQRLRAALRAHTALAGQGVQVSASVGVALAPSGSGEPADGLLARADAALYRAKAGGRDRAELDAAPGFA